MWSSGSVNVCRCLPFVWRCLDLKPLRYCFREVGFVNDVVSVEHRPRLPAAEFHDLTLRHATSTKVAGRRAPEIVHESAFEAGLLASARPNAPKAADALPAPVKNKQPIPLRPPLLQQLLRLGSETIRCSSTPRLPDASRSVAAGPVRCTDGRLMECAGADGQCGRDPGLAPEVSETSPTALRLNRQYRSTY